MEYRQRHEDMRMAVYIPKYVVGHWWEHIFHNHRANRIRRQIMHVPGAMIVLVPWRLESADKVDLFARAPLPGDSRRGEPVRGKGKGRKHQSGKPEVIHMKAKKDATPDDVLDLDDEK